MNYVNRSEQRELQSEKLPSKDRGGGCFRLFDSIKMSPSVFTVPFDANG